MALDFWYDGQMRRYWIQFCRIFEGFQYESGIGATGTKTLRTFPVKLASKNRQVGHLLRNNSENTILSTPQITCEMTSIVPSAERRQNPNHVRTVNIFERAIDPLTNKYTAELGNTYSVETYMSIPYDITMRVDIWTSNEQQKHQFMEQVLILFNPSIDLQTGDNPVDWTSLTIVEIQDIQWTNREMPIGTDDDIEISSITFKMPIWLSPPAKLKRQNIIHQIVTNIGLMSANDSYKEGQSGGYNFSSSDLHTRMIVTPENHQARVDIKVDPNAGTHFEVTLLGENGSEFSNQDQPFDWRALLLKYGQYRSGVSQFRLKTSNNLDDENDIIGIFDFHPTKKNVLLWNPDFETLPINTQQPVDALLSLINPAAPDGVGRLPGVNGFPASVEGQRYLLADDLHPVEEWSNIKADTNDIIEYRNGQWSVVFDASATTEPAVLRNKRSGKQLRWTGEIWIDAISGDYRQGYWRVFL